MHRKALLVVTTVAVGLLVAVGPAGGRSTATTVTPSLRALIGTASNDVQQVTFGGKIGFHVDVSNTGDSTLNHVVIAVASDFATFSDASLPQCARDPKDTKRMVCTLRQMKPTATFSVDFRFNAPTTGATVLTTPSVTVDAQTQGGSGNNGTVTVTGTPVTTALVSSAGNSLVKTFAKGKEAVATSTSLPQHSKFTMPTSLGGFYGVETSVVETTGTPLCKKCPVYVTVLSIPASFLATSPFSPDNPFSFEVTLLPSGEPDGYQPTGLYKDGALVPMCADSPLSETTHICLTTYDEDNKTGILAAGKADRNGLIGFG